MSAKKTYLEIKSKAKKKKMGGGVETDLEDHQDCQKQEQNTPSASHSVVLISCISVQGTD